MEIRFYHQQMPVFIKNLNRTAHIKTSKALVLLEKYGHDVGMPLSRALGANLFELRVTGTTHVRLLYTFHRQTAVILHVFIKKTHALPRRDLNLALKRQQSLD
jgi:phage-related protein